MLKLIFKVYKKNCKPDIKKISTRFFQKAKKSWKKARERCKNPLNEEKTKVENIALNNIGIFLKKKRTKHLYACERYRNLPEDDKQSLAEYRKNYK